MYSATLVSAPAGASDKPNIVLFLSDDHGWADLGCAGEAADVSTPALDALAARGVRFTRAYATSPICNPSRAGLMTGCYQARYGCFWYGGRGLHDATYPTMAELFRAEGYATGYYGYLWADVLSLKVDDVSIHDDFFNLGGHSLLLGRVLSQVRQKSGQQIPMTDLFK